MVNIILSFCLWCLATWFFSHLYYKKSAKETSKCFLENLSKPEDVNWSVKEIIKIYQNMIFDKTGFSSKNELSPLYCPQCGSEKLKESTIDKYYVLKCTECGWYEKIHIADLI